MKRLTLANRLSIRIMMVLIVMSAVIMSVVYFITKDSMAREAESRYEGIIMHANEKIRGVLSDVYLGAINNLDDIQRDLNDPDKLQAHLERMVKQNMYMSSCRLIFEPDYYPSRGHNYEIYAWRDSSGVVKGRQMNENHSDYIINKWYKTAFDKEKGDWTPPYFDRAASQQLTTTYMTHIRDANGRKVGMLGADVSLEWLRLRHQRVDAENHERFEKGFKKQSYSFIISNDGTYIVHPDEKRVLHQKIQDVAFLTHDIPAERYARKMMDGESGMGRLEKNGETHWIFYSFVKYTEWTVVIVVPGEIIYRNGNVLANYIVIVFFVG